MGAGRTAAPDMTRTFRVDDQDISLFEPSWTGDSLGHKTWGTSLVLAQRLSSLNILSTSPYLSTSAEVKCLGLGEGTGLLGMAAVKLMKWTVTLTDLPCITPNLSKNVEYNCHERAEVKDLDWMDPPGDEEIAQGSFEVIIGSDLVYDTHQPKLVVAVLERYLKRDNDSRIVIGYPLRELHTEVVRDFEERMRRSFSIEVSGEDLGMDDWDAEICIRWTIYKWK